MSPLRSHELAERMAELARATAAPRTVVQVLEDVTATAKELISGADTVGVLLVGKNGAFESLAGTSELPHTLDEIQMAYGEGPCVQAALKEQIIRTDDFRTEPRWPRYAAAAVERGVLSGLSVKLYTAERTAGALNMFGSEAHGFDAEDETTGAILAAHAAAALLASKEGEQLKSAMSTRDRIGQAKGIIMERYGVDDVRAFELLKQLSQDSNTRLAEVAQRVIDTRTGA